MFLKREWCRFVYVECTKFCVDFAVIYVYGAFSFGNISIRSRRLWFEFSSYMMKLLPFEYICFKSNNIIAFFCWLWTSCCRTGNLPTDNKRYERKHSFKCLFVKDRLSFFEATYFRWCISSFALSLTFPKMKKIVIKFIWS